jgi:hypothetical protein
MIRRTVLAFGLIVVISGCAPTLTLKAPVSMTQTQHRGTMQAPGLRMADAIYTKIDTDVGAFIERAAWPPSSPAKPMAVLDINDLNEVSYIGRNVALSQELPTVYKEIADLQPVFKSIFGVKTSGRVINAQYFDAGKRQCVGFRQFHKIHEKVFPGELGDSSVYGYYCLPEGQKMSPATAKKILISITFSGAIPKA